MKRTVVVVVAVLVTVNHGFAGTFGIPGAYKKYVDRARSVERLPSYVPQLRGGADRSGCTAGQCSSTVRSSCSTGCEGVRTFGAPAEASDQRATQQCQGGACSPVPKVQRALPEGAVVTEIMINGRRYRLAESTEGQSEARSRKLAPASRPAAGLPTSRPASRVARPTR